MTKKQFAYIVNTTQSFAVRDLKTRYAESLIGSLWIIIYPLTFSLITAGIFSIVFKGLVGKVPYILFILIGFNSWFWFNQTVVKSTKSLVYNRLIIINNKFPTESIIFSIVLTSSIDFIVNLIVTLIFFGLFHLAVSLQSIFYLIFIALLQLIFQTGISLALSAINVYFRDTQNIIDIVLQLLFYLTPVIYSTEMIPGQFTQFIKFNPLTLMIDSYRDVLLNARITSEAFIFGLISVVVFFSGYLIYKRLEKKFTELL